MDVMEIMGGKEIMGRKGRLTGMVGAPVPKCEPPRSHLGRVAPPLYAGRHARTTPLHRCTTRYVRLTLTVMPPLTRADLAELHCIQPVKNVVSILEGGILSHYGAKTVEHKSVADPRIQELREPVWVPGPNGTRRKLHSYANLYVNARNKMLSNIKYNHGDLDICILRVSLDVLDLPGVVVSSQNASSDYARFAAAPGGLAHIDKDMVFAKSWKHPGDQIREWRHGSIINAEVLVPDVVPPEYIEGAYVSCTEARKQLRAELDGEPLAVTVKADLFFRA